MPLQEIWATTFLAHMIKSTDETIYCEYLAHHFVAIFPKNLPVIISKWKNMKLHPMRPFISEQSHIIHYFQI